MAPVIISKCGEILITDNKTRKNFAGCAKYCQVTKEPCTPGEPAWPVL